MKASLLTLIIALSFGAIAQDSTSFFSQPDDGGIVMKRYIDVPISNTALQLSGDWTIETLLRMPPGFDLSQMHIVECYDASTANGGFALRLNNHRVQAFAMGIGVQPNLIGNAFIQEDMWTHIAAAYNETSGVMSIYINGVLDNSAIIGADQFTSVQTMRIGARGDDADVNHYSLIDEVRIWGIARDSAEIVSTINSCLIGNEAGLLAYYTFENETGATVTDQTANGNDGTIINPLVVGNYQDGAYSCDLTASINDLSISTVSVFPNPANDFLNIASDQVINSIEIVNLSGAIVQSEKHNSFSVQSLNAGIYIVQVSTDFGITQTKFIKE